jgi:hypothetical protein
MKCDCDQCELERIHPLPKPPSGLIPGTGYFDAKTKKSDIAAWYAECVEWKIKHGGWH